MNHTELQNDASEHGGFTHILAVAEPENAHDLVKAAMVLADSHSARLSLISCVERPRDLAAIAHATTLREEEVIERIGEKRRRDMMEQLDPLIGDRDIPLHVTVGRSFLEIIRHTLDNDIDLVMKLAEPLPGLQTLLFGSTDQHLLRKCPCPVWLKTSDQTNQPQTIVAAVDLDDWDAQEPDTLHNVNQRVLDAALAIGSSGPAVIHVLHAWDAPGEGIIWTFSSGQDGQIAAAKYVNEIETARRRSMDALLMANEAAAHRLDARVLPQLSKGNARSVISAEVERLSADVLVLGTVARTGLSGLIIGNTAEDVLNSVSCSVVAVKPDGFVSPLVADLRDAKRTAHHAKAETKPSKNPA